MNGPPVVMVFLIVFLAIYFGGRYHSRQMDEDQRRIERWEASQERARVEWARRSHPSSHDEG